MTGRDRSVVVVVGVLAAIAAAWLLVISPKRDQASQLQGQIATAQSTLNAARSQMAQGEAARQAFRSSYASLVRLGEAVPTDDDVPSLIYEVQSAATKAGVDFLGLTLNPSGASGTPNVAPSSSSTSSTSSSSSTPAAAPTPSASTASAPTANTAASAAATSTGLPPGATAGPGGFPIEPFTFTFQGDFFHLADFFHRLERFVVATSQKLAVSGRLLNLDAINLTAGPNGFPSIAATVSATTYLLPASQGLVDGATPSGPAAGAPQQAAATSPAPAATPPAAAATPGAAPAPAVVAPGGGG